MNRPVLVDVCCGVGGATKGYQRAGFRVIGIDVVPQPRYCGDEFLQMDVADLTPEFFRKVRAVAAHGSPPCQASCALTKGTNQGREYVQLIPYTRMLFAATGLPTVIENVQGADVRRDLTLCGDQFDLAVIRHRYFELGRWSMRDPYRDHPRGGPFRGHKGRVAGYRHGEWFEGPYFAVYGDGGGKGSVPQWQQAMDIDWTDVRLEIAEAIPPAYAEFVGTGLMDHLAIQGALGSIRTSVTSNNTVSGSIVDVA